MPKMILGHLSIQSVLRLPLRQSYDIYEQEMNENEPRIQKVFAKRPPPFILNINLRYEWNACTLIHEFEALLTFLGLGFVSSASTEAAGVVSP